MSTFTANNEEIDPAGDIRIITIVFLDPFGKKRLEVHTQELPLYVSYFRQTQILLFRHGELYFPAEELTREKVMSMYYYTLSEPDPHGLARRGRPSHTVVFWHYLNFRDRTGEIFSDFNFFSVLATDTFSGSDFYRAYGFRLNDPCDEFHILCDSENYPGWVCKPIEPMVNRLGRINESLRG